MIVKWLVLDEVIIVMNLLRFIDISPLKSGF